jgi:2-polyprenyl-3-methyl-5-hydroxy-6-metoxy-1,4-benzoquinol methylase
VSWNYTHDPRPDIQALLQVRGRRVLDVGCAAGALGSALKDCGAAYVAGIELTGTAAAEAQEVLDAVVEGDLCTAQLPFPPASFDYLVFADVLEHVPDPNGVLARLLPWLAADGRVVVSVPNMRFYVVLLRLILDRWGYTDSGIRDRTHLRIFTRRSLIAMLEGAGLEVEVLHRNARLFEDQSRIGRLGAWFTNVVRRCVAPWAFRDLLAFQYVVLARRSAAR